MRSGEHRVEVTPKRAEHLRAHLRLNGEDRVDVDPVGEVTRVIRLSVYQVRHRPHELLELWITVSARIHPRARTPHAERERVRVPLGDFFPVDHLNKRRLLPIATPLALLFVGDRPASNRGSVHRNKSDDLASPVSHDLERALIERERVSEDHTNERLERIRATHRRAVSAGLHPSRELVDPLAELVGHLGVVISWPDHESRGVFVTLWRRELRDLIDPRLYDRGDHRDARHLEENVVIKPERPLVLCASIRVSICRRRVPRVEVVRLWHRGRRAELISAERLLNKRLADLADLAHLI